MTSPVNTSIRLPETRRAHDFIKQASHDEFCQPRFRATSRPLKLAIITELIAPYRIPVFNALAHKKEVDLHVIFLSENDPSMRQWRVYKDEITFAYAVLAHWRTPQFAGSKLLLNRGMSRSLSAFAPDVILCGGYNYPASWQAAYWAANHQVPFLLWSESTALDARKRNPAVEMLKARFLNLCCAFVVPGIAAANYLRSLNVTDELIFTAPNAVDNRLFCMEAERSRESEAKLRTELGLPCRYLLYVGRLVKEKGIFELVQAYGELDSETRKQIGLVFAGDGPDRSDLIHRASKIKAGTVQFPGFVHREDLPKFYAFAEALVFPTYTDPWGLVVNEAMSCGLPVIATNVAGCVPDLVQHEWNGLTVPSRDPASLAAAMARLVNDRALQKTMSARSRERIANYSSDNWAAGIVNAAQCSMVNLQ